MRPARLLILAAAIGLGVAAEAAAFEWDDPGHWLPDFAVGLTFIACGALAWGSGAGALLAATGVAWFLGNFATALLYLHRGPLVHLLLAYPGWRPRSRLDLVAIAAGYCAALVEPVWRSDVATIVLAAALMVPAALGWHQAAGRARRERLAALQATAALAAVLIGGAVARIAVPSGEAAEPALLAYEAVLIAVAIGLYARLRGPAASAVADLVVELGEARSGTLRDRLARALGDPTLTLGYWSADARAYVDERGRRLAPPRPDDGRAATYVEREGRPFGVLVHDATVLRDPALVDAVASATRLSASHASLQSEVRARADELIASRRRLLVAGDEERRRLEARLREGPEQRLVELAELLGHAPRQEYEHLERARGQLSGTLEDLRELALGLHPRALVEAGLAGALGSLAERSPVPVELDVRVGRLPPNVESTAYFVCAEALANTAKYSSASSVRVAITAGAGHTRVVVADDGVGSADRSRGTGLQGLADRVEALGGTLSISSPAGGGTRIAADIPHDGEAP